ncbi:hypothetical protein [Amycolatopsis sp. ATCC 39116]|uniref:hypothetical protein n=1 Tax=Amycolatopsis sp. (strain ATCC 39116 / 75iv2) TaxID=385957 RepID=UPI0012FADE8F|nr:hypothetical protein [Amycolatopsis sp. ATCC 39116]
MSIEAKTSVSGAATCADFFRRAAAHGIPAILERPHGSTAHTAFNGQPITRVSNLAGQNG